MNGADRSEATSPTSAVKLALAWAVVGIPLLWGVLETLSNSFKLFH